MVEDDHGGENRAVRLPRSGPLGGVEGIGITLGDSHAHHLRLTPSAVSHRHADDERESVLWSEIDISITRWPHPVIGDWIVPILAAVITFIEWTPDPTTHTARLTTRTGLQYEGPINGHHAVGYRARHARQTQRVVTYLTVNPETRRLLSKPREIIQRSRRRPSASVASSSPYGR